MISKEIIDSEKQVDFPGDLTSLGVELEVNGNGYQSLQHDSLKIFRKNGIWLYKWWSRDGEVGAHKSISIYIDVSSWNIYWYLRNLLSNNL